jgi:ABC-2 type transport system permease protein
VKTLQSTGKLVRLILRRDRIRIPIWIAGIAGLAASTALGVDSLYQNRQQLVEAAAIVQGNAALIAFNGPARAIDTVGGRVVFELGAFTFVVFALMSMFLVGRQTRAEEESGRTELVRSTVVGRHAQTTAALIVVFAVNVILGGIVAATLISLDLSATGSVALGASLAAVGFVFATLTVVVAQMTAHTRTVYGIASALIGLAYVLRAAGDVGDGTLSWLSPIGWGQATRPFAGEQWWPLLLPLGAAVLQIVVAFALTNRRDMGAGLVPPRPGPARASGALLSPLGLAVRLQRGVLVGWTAGLFLGGLSYGSIAGDVEDLVADNEQMREMVARAGGDLVDSFFATALLVLALIATGYAIQATLRLRTEESAGRAEPLLAGAISRWRWAASHLAVALVGSAVVVVAGGLGMGLASAVSLSDPGEILSLAGASLAYIPAVWVLVGVAFALFGVWPRAALVPWGALAVAFTVGFFGPLLDLPAWLVDASPFSHVPQVPVAEVTAGSLTALIAIAVGLGAVGLIGWRRRDVG